MRQRLLLAGAGLCAVAGAVELVLRAPDDRGLQWTLVVVATAALALTAWRPITALVVMSAGFTTVAAAGAEPATTGPVLAFTGALLASAEALPLRRSLAGLALVAGAMVAQGALTGSLSDIAWMVFVLVLPAWTAGRLLADRRQRIAELESLHRELRAEQARSADLAAQAERSRIAREMHDMLSHGIGLITLQAAAGSRATDRATARDALTAVAGAGRRALAELDAALGAAEPRAEDLDTLLDGVRASGLHVALARRTIAAPPAAVGVAAHRILQEALTNILKHASATRVDIRVEELPDAVELVVEDDGDGSGAGGGVGLGLTGMRERAHVYGGELEAGRGASGGFRVRAWIPVSR